MPRPLLNLSLAILSLLLALAVVEVLLQVLSPVELRLRGTSIQLPYLKEYEITAQPGSRLPPSALHHKNSLGFRGDPPPQDFADHLTVIAVGGSTTECFALGDGLCWPERLGARLAQHFAPFWINNAGIAGHTSQGHIELLRQHILSLKPDVIVFLIGVNDLYFSEFTAAYDSRLTQETTVIHDARQWLAEHSALVALGLAAYKQWRAKRLDLTGQDRDFTQLVVPETPADQVTAEIERHRSHDYFGYADRLRQIITMTREAGVIPIFLTQPAVYGPAMDPRTGVDLAHIRNGVDGFDGAASWTLLESYNDVMRTVAVANNVLTVDLAKAMPKDTTYYLDQVHFTAQGADLVAQEVYPLICAALAQHFPDQVIQPCGQTARGTQ